MQQNISLRLLPSEAASTDIIKEYIASATGKKPADISGFYILKQSVDARSKTAHVNLTCKAFINEPFHDREIRLIEFRDVHAARQEAIIAGAGPAGLFAALKLIEHGIRPVILERGKDVRARRRDLAALNKEGIINPESNYCFGEGGAGTYSDGKLYTRSTKRGDVNRILNLLVQFGAEENILYHSHPHIGTNKLPQIITSMRRQITQSGGKFLFEKKVTELLITNNVIEGVQTADGEIFKTGIVILATGHSARDIFTLLDRKKIQIHFKPFALGVRIEHPQTLIDSIQYHNSNRGPFLPPAAYSLVQQVQDHGVFSFCMCPGGIIAPASTAAGEIVVNGWSPSRRNNPFANSGIVINIEENDVKTFSRYGALAGLHFQQKVEQDAFNAGGGKFVAPAQRMMDFINKKVSATLPDCSYLPGIRPYPLNKVLPDFVFRALQLAFLEFGKKMKGYLTNDAVVVATESRTSSPVRIPRDPVTLEHPQVGGLYPAGEGAGYAGGIVSAAMDGERIAQCIIEKYNHVSL
ncbi:MAG TPA: FAD-dependent oxidoreductase [Chitinophagaceae bacterium]